MAKPHQLAAPLLGFSMAIGIPGIVCGQHSAGGCIVVLGKYSRLVPRAPGSYRRYDMGTASQRGIGFREFVWCLCLITSCSGVIVSKPATALSHL